LEFSNLQLRKKICQKDKAVVKIVQEMCNHKIKTAGLDDRRHILEYAVKMRELPRQYRMDNLVMLGKVSLETIKRLTNVLVKFHCTTRTLAQIKNFGKQKFMKMKIVENFKTLTKLAMIDPNSIFDVDNNEDGSYNMVHRYDNIESNVLQCTLLC
jgi:aminoglycoside phosphotransferase family enzyme